MADSRALEQAKGLPIVAELTRALQPMVRALADAAELFRRGTSGGETGAAAGGGASGGGKQDLDRNGRDDREDRAVSAAEVMGTLGNVVAGLTQTFIGLTSAARPFVEALNPSLMMAFNQTLRDFAATVGKALEPIVQVAMTTLRDFADALTPVVAELRPVVEMIAQTFGGILATAGRLVAQLLSALAPVLQVVAEVFDALGEVLRGLMVAASGLAAALAPLVSLLSGVTGYVVSWLAYLAQGLVKCVLVATAFVAKLLGLTSVIDGMLGALTNKDKGASVGAAAATNAQTLDVAGFGRELAQKAFIATGDLGKEEKNDPLKEIVGILEAIKKDSLQTIITNAIRAAIPGGEKVAGAVEYVGGGIGSVWDGTVGAAGRGIGSAAAWSLGYGWG